MILTPNKGRLVAISGRIAQWIAQASEVMMPNPSQFVFIFIRRTKITIFAILLQVFHLVNDSYFIACL